MKPELQHALDKASEWLESLSAEEFLAQYESLQVNENDVTVEDFVKNLTPTKLTCMKCLNQTTKAEMNKIAKLGSYGVKQEYCTMKQCTKEGCNSRLFYVYK